MRKPIYDKSGKFLYYELLPLTKEEKEAVFKRAEESIATWPAWQRPNDDRIEKIAERNRATDELRCLACEFVEAFIGEREYSSFLERYKMQKVYLNQILGELG